MSSTSADVIDINTFKAWLQGVEDMFEEDWVPNANQWKKIRQKIELLTEQAPQIQVQQPFPQPFPQPAPQFPTFNTPITLPVQPFSPGPATDTPPRPFRPAAPPSMLETKPSESLIDNNGKYQSSFS